MIPNFQHEIKFATARSGGSGGQNVNKVETMVEGRWAFGESALFSDEQKQQMATKLANRIVADGSLLVKAQDERTQLGNKALVVKKIHQLVQQALAPVKPRMATKPTKASRLRNREMKQQQSHKKADRRWRRED